MNFSEALTKLNEGNRLRRANWNGKNMWIFICKDYTTHDVPFNVDWNDSRKRLPFIIMKTADDCLVPWLASQTDILSNDWEIVS